MTAVSTPLLELARATRTDAVHLPNAVEPERFAAGVPPADDPELAALLAEGRPIAGYYGALARWLDYELLYRAACLRPDWRFVLIGPSLDESFRGRPLFELPNVAWLGPRPYRLLPGYLAAFDVALIPFVRDEVTRAVSPLKLYEYLAGGKPVVATAIPECQAIPEVEVVGTPEELARALDACRARGSDVAFRERLRDLGRQSSWAVRVETTLTALEARSGRIAMRPR